jgi:HEPN domain-containing protein
MMLSMALPSSREAQPFYQAAMQRFEDAKFLLRGKRTTAAVYMAGYVVECMLKAMVLSVVPPKARRRTVDSFRGSKAHDFEWLKRIYHKNRGAAFPPEIARSFSIVNTWRTSLRYQPGSAKMADAQAFMKAAQDILDWSDARL